MQEEFANCAEEGLESPEQGSMGDRKGKLWAVTSSDKQCWAVVSCHTHQIHTGQGEQVGGGTGKGWRALLRRVSFSLPSCGHGLRVYKQQSYNYLGW